MTEAFTYTALATRVVFGSGTLVRIAEELRALGCQRALVLSTPEQQDSAQAVASRLGELCAGTFTQAAMHTPVEISERAVKAVREMDADCTVAIGGGSTTGLGKAIALRTDLPQIVVPTTYAGSEATPILGETRDGRKTTQRSEKVLPEVILYDVDLTLTLPPGLSATSGINAIAHAVEALYTQDANPIISMMAERGIEALARALPPIMKNPVDKSARSDALLGAWLCGMCLGAVGMALHHKLCHTLGGSFDLPHAETHAVILPHVAAFNTGAAPAALALSAIRSAVSVPPGILTMRKHGRRTFSRSIPAARAIMRSRASTRRPASATWLPAAISPPARRTPCPGIASASTCGIGPD